MKIVGIVAEYNPFHLGHEYQLHRARALSGADFVVVCMSGSFTQRGEAACMDKWTRAEIALKCGADAVLELPTLFATRTADAFARGGMTILDGVGCDAISFGCETDDLDLLRRMSMLRTEEPEKVSRNIQKKLALGMTQSRAQGEAWAEYLGVDARMIGAPNNVLAAEYLRALTELRSGMEIFPVLRRGDYHDASLPICAECEAPKACFSSAAAIRAAIRAGMDWHPFVPAAARVPTQRMHEMDDLLLHTLRRMTTDGIAALPDVTEGLEFRVRKCADAAATAEELIDQIKCKRYTRARIQRLCAHALLEMDSSLTARHPIPDYARLIGMRADAAPIMRELKRRSRLPIISDSSMLSDHEVFQLECRATDLRALLCDDPILRRAGQEYTHKFVKV